MKKQKPIPRTLFFAAEGTEHYRWSLLSILILGYFCQAARLNPKCSLQQCLLPRNSPLTSTKSSLA